MNNRLLVAKKLLELARCLAGDSVSTRVAISLVRDVGKLKKMVADYGITTSEDGKIYMRRFTPLGFFDYSKPPIEYQNLNKAVDQTEMIRKSIEINVTSYTRLLDEITKFKHLVQSHVEKGSIDTSELQGAYDSLIRPFIQIRAKDPDKLTINKHLTDLGSSLVAGETLKDALEAIKNVEEPTGRLLDKWRMQLNNNYERRKKLMAIRNFISKGGTFVELASEPV